MMIDGDGLRRAPTAREALINDIESDFRTLRVLEAEWAGLIAVSHAEALGPPGRGLVDEMIAMTETLKEKVLRLST